MPYLIALGAISLVLGVWLVMLRHTLAMLDENTKNTMSRLGVQLSSRWDALSDLMDLTRGSAQREYQALSEIIKARRPITAESSVRDTMEQENLLAEAMGRIAAAAELCPGLKATQSYQRIMDSVNRYEGMTRQGHLVYNDSVTRLNRRIRLRLTSFLAGVMGFHSRDYLETKAMEVDDV